MEGIIMSSQKTIVQDHAKNFETLLDAARNNKLLLLDCTLIATGEHVAVICAMNKGENEMYDLVPFAQFFNGNPYEILNPPEV
jgi:hypothetical protein